ncbi:MAG: hypothetical protein K2P80_09435 [Beijerinckiaceae bacterium]|nr:hypothetical protein [Beijerinckiaceae bacterium]
MSLADRLAGLLPRPRLRPAAGLRKPVERIIVFARLPNPTFDYYFSARMNAAGQPQSVLVDIRDPEIERAEPDGTFALICRYTSAKVLDWIERHRDRLAGVGYFTDDDVSAFVSSNDADLGYRFFLFGLGIWPLRRLNRQIDILYVSTPALADVFAEARPVLLPPAPPPDLWRSAGKPHDASAPVRIVFHAKAVHETEHRFLAPIVAEILSARPGVQIEISAERRSIPHWRGTPGVALVPEVPWLDYVGATREAGADIVLVPLMPSRVNGTRADTKRIDVARFGAAGVFSASRTYGEADSSGECIIPNEARAWIETVVKLIDEPDLRARAAAATRMRVEAMSERAAMGIPGLTLL